MKSDTGQIFLRDAVPLGVHVSIENGTPQRGATPIQI